MKKFSKELPTNCFEAWQRANAPAKPELSSGTPEELTPNQIAERAASAAALSLLSGCAEIKIDNGWQLLASHVLPKRGPKEVDDNDVMSKELLRCWADGWKVGCYDLDVDCLKTAKDEQRVWMAGVADGTKALMILEKEEQKKRGLIEKLTDSMKLRIKKILEGVQTGKMQRMAAEITDVAEMEEIWKAHKKNGGSMSYEGIENERRFGLKWANGMTAYRVIKKFEKLKKAA